jgi:hypothetical protein
METSGTITCKNSNDIFIDQLIANQAEGVKKEKEKLT